LPIVDRDYTPAARAALAGSAQAREAADFLFALVAGADRLEQDHDERARLTVQMRRATARCWQWMVLADLLSGDPWPMVAGRWRMTEATLRAQFGDAVTHLQVGSDPAAPLPPVEHAVGMVADTDPEGTATALDSWATRHRAPWDDPVDEPVTRALWTGAT
jgi:hypothetical protein